MDKFFNFVWFLTETYDKKINTTLMSVVKCGAKSGSRFWNMFILSHLSRSGKPVRLYIYWTRLRVVLIFASGFWQQERDSVSIQLLLSTSFKFNYFIISLFFPLFPFRWTKSCRTPNQKRHQQQQQGRWWKSQKRSRLPVPSQPRKSHRWAPASPDREASSQRRVKKSVIDWLKQISECSSFLHCSVRDQTQIPSLLVYFPLLWFLLTCHILFTFEWALMLSF